MEKLREWGISGDEADAILDEVVEGNYLNDKRFIEAFVRGKFNGNKWGRVKIRQALREKKLPDKEIEAGLLKIDNDEYIKVATLLFRKKAEEVSSEDERSAKSKLYYYMMSKGFESELVMKLLYK